MRSKTLRPYRLDKPFELHADNASLRSLQRRRHVSHHQARWLHLLAEYQYRAVHIPADFLTRKRFPDGPGPAPLPPPHTGYAEPDSALELFPASGAASAVVAARPAPEPPRFLRADFAAAIRAALPSDPVPGPLAAAPKAEASSLGAAFEAPPAAASPSRLPCKGGRRAG